MDSASANPNTSLYVGDLPATTTEKELAEEFAKSSPVVGIRLFKTYNGLCCYAQIDYLTHDDAKKAMEELNHQPLLGVPMRIMWFSKDSRYRRSNVGNVFIKNLEKTITMQMLHDTFAAFGNILSCKVALDINGKSKGFGFISFEEESSAENAIERVNGALLKEVQVYVGKFIPRGQRQTEVVFNNIYVKNLPAEYTEEDLKTLFGVIGEIGSVKIVSHIDPNENVLKFGFVCFKEFDCAKNAVEQFHQKEINDKVLHVSRAEKKIDREARLRRDYIALNRSRRYRNLYITLSKGISENEFLTEFQKFGTIESAKLMKDEFDVSRGIGFVCYSTQAEAKLAIREMNGKNWNNQILYVSLSLSKQDRQDISARHVYMQLGMRNGYFLPQLVAPGLRFNRASNQFYAHLPQVCNRFVEQNQATPVNEAACSTTVG